jgi:hypothetical protein
MPEGDTIHRTAARLRSVLVGRSLTRVDLPRQPQPWPALEATITGVEARGKHLLVRSSDGLVVHTHQQMTGSWHLYAPGERWRKSPRAARVVLGVPGAVAVCFTSPVVEVLDARAEARHPTLRRLGPDLCDPGADLQDALARLRRLSPPERSIGEVLLDQRIVRGRQRLPLRRAVPPRDPPGHTGGCRRGGDAAIAADHRERAAPGQPRQRWRAHHGRRGARRQPLGVRAVGSALQTLRHRGRIGPPRRPRTCRVLVPDLPTAARRGPHQRVTAGDLRRDRR